MPFLERGQWRVGVRVAGDKLSKTFPRGTSKKIADEYERKLKLSLIDPDLAEKKRLEPIFDDYADQWIANVSKLEHSISHQQKCEQVTRQHLSPIVGTRKISDISNQDVMQIQRALKEKGYKVQTINNILAVMSSIFKQAIFDGILLNNPCSGIKRFKKGQRVELQVWTFEERDRFLATLYQSNFEYFQICAIALFCGLRPSEIRGLCRDALDFERCQIRVFRQWCTKQKKLVDYTKTREARTVPIPRAILNYLSDKKHLAGSTLLFGRMVNAFGHQKLKPYMAQANVKVIRMHDFRHTFASHLLLQGSGLMEVKELLGHRKLESTMIYLHYIPDRNQGATDKLLGKMSWLSSDNNVIAFSK